MTPLRPASLIFAALVVFLGAVPASSQTLYGFGPVLGSNDIFVYTIDPTTGAFARIADAGDPIFNVAALDSVGQRLFYVYFSTLYTLNLKSKVTTSMPVLDTAATLEYDRTTNRIYEVYYIGGLVWVEAINPENGQNTQLAFLGNVGSVLASAIDRAGQRLFVLIKVGLVETTLVQVDLRTGVFTAVPSGSVASGGGLFVSLEFDDLARALYGTGQRSGDSAYSVFSIDDATGAFAPVVTLTASAYTTALDSARRRLFFTSPSSLFTLDLTSLSISSVPIERCCPTLFLAPAETEPIPAMGRLAWIVFGAGLAAVGLRFAARLA